MTLHPKGRCGHTYAAPYQFPRDLAECERTLNQLEEELCPECAAQVAAALSGEPEAEEVIR